MAHKEQGVPYAGGDTLRHYYNVDRAVGTGAFNLRDDVQLVQFFLVKYFQRHPEERPMGVKPITIDGFFGPITARHIIKIQKIMLLRGCSVYADGRVDPANSSGISTISQTRYTIIHLNHNFSEKDPDQSYYDHLQDHPLIIANAPQLRAALLASQ